MQGKNIIIYLDEILVEGNFLFLEVSNGGIISVKDEAKYENDQLISLWLDHVFQIEELKVDNFTALEDLTIWMDAEMKVTGVFEDIFNNSSCKSIVILWDDEKDFSTVIEEQFFMAFYRVNDEEFSYISKEFCNRFPEDTPYVVLNVLNKKSENVEILEIPQEMLLRSSRFINGDWQRLRLEDINFDGYKDIIFLGYNVGIELYHECIVYLWEPSRERFQLNRTAPFHFDCIDEKRKRLTYSSGFSAFDNIS